MAMTRKTWFLIVLVLVAAAFLGGFIPQYLKAREASQELRAAQSQLRAAGLRNELCRTMIETARDDFGTARRDLDRFFTDLSNAAKATPDPQEKARWEALGARRSVLLAKAASLDRGLVEDLQELYGEIAPPSPAGQ
jgi:type II secretory pathway pseudopilin PulG